MKREELIQFAKDQLIQSGYMGLALNSTIPTLMADFYLSLSPTDINVGSKGETGPVEEDLAPTKREIDTAYSVLAYVNDLSCDDIIAAINIYIKGKPSLTADEFLKAKGYFNSPHFPFDTVSSLITEYATIRKVELYCERCEGTGQVSDGIRSDCDLHNCPVCKGKGVIKSSEKVEKPNYPSDVSDIDEMNAVLDAVMDEMERDNPQLLIDYYEGLADRVRELANIPKLHVTAEAQSEVLPTKVIAWLGQYRDNLPSDAVSELQDICGPIKLLREANKVYMCVVCGRVPVDVHNGFDTCPDCASRI